MEAWSPGEGERDRGKVGVADEVSGASLGSRLTRDREHGNESSSGRKAWTENRMAATKGSGDKPDSLYGFNRDPRVSAFNLANAAIGSGVLGFPNAFRHLGLLGGLFTSLLIYCILIIALRVLIRAARHFRCSSFQEIVTVALGPLMSFVANVMILVYIFGGLISYLIVTADIFLPFLVRSLPRGSLLANRTVFLCLVCAFVIIPLALKRTMASLKWWSILAICMLSYLAITLFWFFVGKLVAAPRVSEEFRDVALFNIDSQFFACLGIFVFGLECNIQLVSIFAELSEDASPLSFFPHVEEPSRRVGGESKEGGKITGEGVGENGGSKLAVMDGVIFAGTGICLVLYVSVGFFGYLVFPHVESDILSSFPQGNLALNLVRFGMTVVTIVAYPVNLFPARSICTDVALQISRCWKQLLTPSSSSSSSPSPSPSSTHLPLPLPVSSSSAWFTPGLNQALLSVVLVVLPLGIALSISKIGTVQSLVGSSSGVLVTFVIPGLLLLMGIDPRVGIAESTESSGDAFATLPPLLAEAVESGLGRGQSGGGGWTYENDGKDFSLLLPLLARASDQKLGQRPVYDHREGQPGEIRPGKLPTASWFTFALGWFVLIFGVVIFVSTVSVQLSNAFPPHT